MKYSVQWLKELAPFSWPLEELTQRLTMAGVEVEGIQVQGEGLDKVVVAQILKSDKHPNADKLSVCEVDSGSGIRQIVCGAKNYKTGDKVPLALTGAKLPNGMEIKRSKLRGVESEGMMCSAKELGVAEDTEGLFILPPELQTGTPITEALGLNDILLELEITPNRPDLLSHWGMAREIAALAGLPPPNPAQLLPDPERQKLSSLSNSHPSLPIQVEDFTLCPRYTGRIIRGVKVGPSPLWLRKRLESLGHRSISNVVDITNYILEEIGQPLHAFDLKLLHGPAIKVRKAVEGEKLVRLDGETSTLKSEMLVIADQDRPVAIAGIMGGMETGVSDQTTDLLLESATFQTSSVRKTSKTLGVSSDSSYRFERGVDPELAEWASLRATQLILQICGGTVEGPLIDVRGPSTPPSPIEFRYTRVRQVLGVDLADSEMDSILIKLGCQVEKKEGDCLVHAPTYRMDLEREIDLIEEISRVYGIQNIPGKISPAPLSTTRDSEAYALAQELRNLVSSLGLDEAQNYTVVSEANCKNLGLPAPENLRLANPLSSDMDFLRTSLLPGLLQSAAANLSGGNPGVALFEIGNTFQKEQDSTGEKQSLGILIAGIKEDGAIWEHGVQGKRYDFYDLKGFVEGLLQKLHLQTAAAMPIPEEVTFLQKGLGFAWFEKNQRVGMAGKIQSRISNSIKISHDIFYAEFDCEWLKSVKKAVTSYQPWPHFPPIQRDIAMTVSATEQHEKISNTLTQLGRKHAEPRGIFLQKVNLFDIFESEKIGTDKKSLAYSLTYRSSNRTLTDQEVNDIHHQIKKQLQAEIVCELRE